MIIIHLIHPKHLPQIDPIGTSHIVMAPDIVFIHKKRLLIVVPPRAFAVDIRVLVCRDSQIVPWSVVKHTNTKVAVQIEIFLLRGHNRLLHRGFGQASGQHGALSVGVVAWVAHTHAQFAFALPFCTQLVHVF